MVLVCVIRVPQRLPGSIINLLLECGQQRCKLAVMRSFITSVLTLIQLLPMVSHLQPKDCTLVLSKLWRVIPTLSNASVCKYLPCVMYLMVFGARLASLDAGANRGFVFRPEIEDEVIVGYLADDPNHPVVLGMLHSSAKAAPIEADDKNPQKGYVSHSKMKVLFDDAKTTLTIETPAGNSITLTEADSGIVIKDQNKNQLILNSDGIGVTSTSDLKISASGDISIEGTNVSIAAKAALKLEGSSEAKLNSGGTTQIKGSLVQIN